MHSSFAERTEIASKITNYIHPFYENEGISFYRNKLISIEDIIEQKEVDSGNSADFKSLEMKAYHILTFQDEMGNTHEYQSPIKPKNIDSIMYYVVKNGKIKDVFSQSDKRKFKDYIHTNTEFKHPSKIYNFISFCTDSIFRICFVIFLFMSLVFALSAFFLDSNNNQNYVLSFASAAISYFIIMPMVVFSDDLCKNKWESFIQEKKDEEKDVILESFI